MPASQGQRESTVYSQGRSPSPRPAQSTQHRRGYQACDPCRQRKVKCDLGSMFDDLR